jgi:hypothetical protein
MSPSSSPAMRLTGAAGRCARRAAIRPSSVSRFRPRAPGSSLGVELVQGAPPSVLQPGARGDQILAVIDEKLDRAGDVGVLYMPQKRRAPIIGRGARRRIGRRTGRSATSCRCERSVNRRQHVGAGNRHAQLARASTRRPEPQPGVEVRPCHRSGRSPHDGTGDAVTRSWSSRRPSTPCVPSWAASPCAGPWSSVKGRGRIADAVQRRTGRRRDRSRGRRHHVDCKEPAERPRDSRCRRAALCSIPGPASTWRTWWFPAISGRWSISRRPSRPTCRASPITAASRWRTSRVHPGPSTTRAATGQGSAQRGSPDQVHPGRRRRRSDHGR